MEQSFLGIDLGTQGIRIVLLTSSGKLLATGEQVFRLSEESREEQSPDVWWSSCVACFKQLHDSPEGKIGLTNVHAVSVTSTSGTVIPLDEDHKPIHNALMYSDKRSHVQAQVCSKAAAEYYNNHFTTFNTSTGLSKIVWFLDTYPLKARKIEVWAHAADYITGMLTGCWGVTDYTNALKTGFDLKALSWPDYIHTELSINRSMLPNVVPSGTVIGVLYPDFCEKFGLPSNVEVTAGITDGCASQIASGAVNPGDWNTTIGTTMVIKGVTSKQLFDEAGRIYSHRHPEGYWMPGGASNTGADWVTNEFGDELIDMNKAAEQLIPTGYIAYPLRQAGERFPMVAPEATGFEPPGLSKKQRFAANMEGVAYLERYAYELIESFTEERISTVFTAGGASASEVWNKIRCNVLNVRIVKMKEVSGAVGAAILAASNTYYTTLGEAVSLMTTIEKEFHPEPELSVRYDTYYKEFLKVMQEKGYIQKGEIHA